MSIEIHDVMVNKVITIKRHTTLENAVKLMNKHEIGCLIVEEEGKPIGIITERDLLKRVLATSKETRKTKAEQIMTKELISVSPKTEIEEAARLMFQKRSRSFQ